MSSHAHNGRVYGQSSITEPSLASKKSVSTSSDRGIIIDPKEVVIDGIAVNGSHAGKVCVRNIGKTSRRIRFVPPTAKGVRLTFPATTCLAPGLEVSAEVEIAPEEDRDYNDSIYIICDNEKIEIPIRGCRPSADIWLETALDIGQTVHGLTSVRYVELKNVGLKSGHFMFVADPNLPLRFVPPSDVLHPGSSMKVKVEFVGTELGAFEASVSLEVDGLFSRTLDITASVAEQKCELIFPNGGIVNSVFFGTLYYGQERYVETVLVNHGPMRMSFLTQTMSLAAAAEDAPFKGDLDEDSATPVPVVEQSEVFMTAVPPQGVVMPYSKVPVRFVFNPIDSHGQQRGFKSSLTNEAHSGSELFHTVALIETLESPQQIRIDLSGKGIKPNVGLSSTNFNFGECPVSEHRDLILSIKNQSEELPFDFFIMRIANFKAFPDKGRLQPSQSQQVILTFSPNQLGQFESVLKLDISNGIKTIVLSVVGNSSTKGTKRRLIGGPQATDKDFKPSLNLVACSTIDSTITTKYKRRDPYEEDDSSDLFPINGVNAFGLNQEEYIRRKRHREFYNGYLKVNREVRQEHIRTQAKAFTDPYGVDMGMEPAEGLIEPKLVLPQTIEPLWMAKPSTEETRPHTKEHIYDENRLFKKKFKPKPTGPNEIRECKLVLSPKDLVSITCGPKTLDFGVVCVHSVTSKSFTVTNILKQHIVVSIMYDSEELHRSGPDSQVVPPGATAGFDITFLSDVVQTYRKLVTYTINEAHTYKFSVLAQVVPVSLKLSREEIDFRFFDDNMTPTVTEEVIISNPLNCRAEFKWFSRGNTFTVAPNEGYVEAFKSVPVVITFRPTSVNKNEDTLVLKVTGGPDVLLHCLGDVPETKVIFVEKKVDLGKLAVGVSRDAKLSIRNVGPNDAVYWLETIPSNIIIHPRQGRVVTNSRQDVVATLAALSPQVYEVTVNMTVRGGKSTKATISAEAVQPQVRVDQDEFEFGAVYMGVSSRQVVTIQNQSPVTAQLVLDLSAHPEFSIVPVEIGFGRNTTAENSVALDEDTSGESPMSIICSGGSNDDDPNPAHAPLKTVPLGCEDDSAAHASSSARTAGEGEGLRYQLTVVGNRSLNFYLVFTPMSVASHAFELPLTVTGMQQSAGLRRAVGAEGVKPRVLLAQSLVDFGTRIVLTERVKKAPYTLDLTITSNDTKRLQWDLDVRSLPDVFRVEPFYGILDAGQSFHVRVTFNPREAGTYQVTVPLMLDKAADRAYLEFAIAGTGAYPRLAFDRPAITLPTVPLAIRSSSTFYVINQGYDTLEVRHRVPVDTQHVPITLSFPDGILLGFGKDRLPVEVTFLSKKPIAFNATIDFYDTDANKFSIPISGMADNSVMSVWPFLAALPESDYEIQAKENRPVMLVEKVVAPPPAPAPAPTPPPPPTAEPKKDKAKKTRIGSVSETASERSVRNLVRWLSNCVLKNPIQEIPDDLAANNGALLMEILETLCGKTGMTIRPPRFSNNRRDALSQLVQYYEEVLNFLKSQGALLSRVNPEHLLTPDDNHRRHMFLDQASAFQPPSAPGSPLSNRRSTFAPSKPPSPAPILVTPATPGSQPPTLRVTPAAPAILPAPAPAPASGPSKPALSSLVLKAVPEAASPSPQASPRQTSARRGESPQAPRKPVTVDKSFPALHRDAWVTLLFQIIRIFVLSRVTLRSFRTLPGIAGLDEGNALAAALMQNQPKPPALRPQGDSASASASGGDNANAGGKRGSMTSMSLATLSRNNSSNSNSKDKGGKSDPTLLGSNVYSQSEALLLRWLATHFAKVNPASARRIIGFDTDLRDGNVLAATILSHVPNIPRLRTLRARCSTQDDFDSNAEKVVSALKELRLDYVPTIQDIVEGNGRDLALYCQYLYTVLPQFVPKTTIDFTACLNERVTKTIELTNPSSRVVHYQVRLAEGAPDFSISQDTVRLESKGQVAFPVDLVSRFSKPVTGRLIFQAIRAPGFASASTLVFSLRAVVSSRKPHATIRTEARVYELRSVDVPVQNPFPSDCDFQISFTQDRTVEEHALSSNPPPPRRGQSKKPAGRGGDPADTDGAMSRVNGSLLLPDAFWCKMPRLRIKEGETGTVPLTFIPFAMGAYRCQMLFLDEKVGEFVYEIVGTATLPDPLDQIKCKCEANATVTTDFLVPSKNSLLDRARNALLEIAKQCSAARGSKDVVRERDVLRKVSPSDEAMANGVTYKVELTSAFFTTPDSVFVSPSKIAPLPLPVPAASDASHGEQRPPKATKLSTTDPSSAVRISLVQQASKLGVTFHPKAAGMYPAKLVLRSPYDLRVYDIDGTAVNQSSRLALHFSVSARQSVTQDIPISNPTDKEFRVQASLNAPHFSGPREMMVPAHATVHYPLVFRPPWVSETTGELTLTNAGSGEKHAYELKGIGEEPLSEDHIVVTCMARQSVTRTLRITNITKDECTYKVESDLSMVSGEATVAVGRGGESEYELGICSLRGGNFLGTVTFVAPNGHYLWYTIEVLVDDPPPDGAPILLRTHLRKPIAVDISLANSTAESADFDVVMLGDGLLGADVLTIPANSSATYELMFSPLVAASSRGSIAFYNDRLGQVWFALDLIADPPIPLPLPPMRCEIGRSCAEQVMIENPLGEEVSLTVTSDNTLNFSVSPAPLLLPPYDSAIAEVRYTPSSLSDVETGTITFAHPQIGEYIYSCSGRGETPTPMPATEIASAFGQTGSASIAFRNPFPRALPVTLRLLTDQPQNVFSLLLKKHSKINVPSLGPLQIPVSFSPASMIEATAKVVVEVDEELRWVYPVRGVCEAISVANAVSKFKCRARTCLRDTLEVKLSGLEGQSNPDTYTYEVVLPSEQSAVLSRALHITPVNPNRRISSPSQPLLFNVVFEPLRPLRAAVDLIVSKASGGRWRFEVQVEATAPDIDDTIIIEGVLNKTSSVSFRLTNHFSDYAPFSAIFTPDSPPEFSITPKSGVLEPFASQGTQFVVAYRPVEYGKTLTGRLIISTPEMQWTYDVRGTHPLYTPPVPTHSRIDHKLAPDVEARLVNKSLPINYVRANLRPQGQSG